MKKIKFAIPLTICLLVGCNTNTVSTKVDIKELEVSIEESKVNFVRYEEKIFELFGTKQCVITDKSDEYAFSYKCSYGLTVELHNSENFERFSVFYNVYKGINDSSAFTLLDQVIELVSYIGGENTPFTKKTVTDIIEGDWNEAEYYNRENGYIYKTKYYKPNYRNSIFYNAYTKEPDLYQTITIHGYTKASMTQ